VKETLQRISDQVCEDCDEPFEATAENYCHTPVENYYVCDSCMEKRIDRHLKYIGGEE